MRRLFGNEGADEKPRFSLFGLISWQETSVQVIQKLWNFSTGIRTFKKHLKHNNYKEIYLKYGKWIAVWLHYIESALQHGLSCLQHAPKIQLVFHFNENLTTSLIWLEKLPSNFEYKI